MSRRPWNRVPEYATSDLLSCPAVRVCLPLDSIPWERMTPEEKQRWFNEKGQGYVRVKTNSELAEMEA